MFDVRPDDLADTIFEWDRSFLYVYVYSRRTLLKVLGLGAIIARMDPSAQLLPNCELRRTPPRVRGRIAVGLLLAEPGRSDS